MLAAVVSRLSGYWPFEDTPDAPDALREALHTLDWELPAADLRRAGCVVAVGIGGAVGAVAYVASASSTLAALLAVGCGLAVVDAVERVPRFLARLRRTRALCASSDLVGRLVLRARTSRSPERAATFAARTGSDPLSRSLDAHVRRAAGTPRSGLDGFAAAWVERFPELERSTSLVTKAVESPDADRDALLDRALSVVVDATRERMESFAVEIHGPATAVYAFGVLLPLALVGVLPAARVGGISVPLAALAVVYDLFLPVGLVCATCWFLARRPVTFAAPLDVGAVDARGARWRPPVVAVVVAALAWVVAAAIVAPWTAPVAAAGVGVGGGLLAHFRPAKAVHDRVRAVEAGLADALTLVGRRVGDGDPVEVAVEGVAADLSDEVGELFAEAAAVQRRLHVPLRAAFLGEFGVLDDVPSPRVRAAAALLSVAAVEGRPTGEALVRMGEQLRALDRAEREGARRLASVTETLANTATAFGPLVGGATVALSARMAAVDATAAGVGTGFSTPALGTVIGGYALVMAATLTALSTGLRSGLDPTLVGYRVGAALVAAAVSFLVGFVAAGLLV